MKQPSIFTVGTTIIAIILVFTVLKYASNLFAPIVLALVLGVVLSPLSDVTDKLGAPRVLSAFSTMILGLIAILTIAFFLEPHVMYAFQRAPLLWLELQSSLIELQSMLRGLEEISAGVAEAIDPESTKEEKPSVAIPTLSDAVFAAPQYLAQVMIFIGTLYFFLLSRREVYRSMGAYVGQLSEGDLLLAEARVSRYFLTIAIINACFGVIVTVVMTLLGMPSPVFWGLLAFLVNFVLYLGPAALGCSLIVAGIVTFDGAYSFLPAALYLAMNATEGQFVTPSLVGKRMSVNPLLVFLSLVFWLWLWGQIGGIVAIPILIWGIVILEKIAQQKGSEHTAMVSA